MNTAFEALERAVKSQSFSWIDIAGYAFSLYFTTCVYAALAR